MRSEKLNETDEVATFMTKNKSSFNKYKYSLVTLIVDRHFFTSCNKLQHNQEYYICSCSSLLKFIT